MAAQTTAILLVKILVDIATAQQSTDVENKTFEIFVFFSSMMKKYFVVLNETIYVKTYFGVTSTASITLSTTAAEQVIAEGCRFTLHHVFGIYLLQLLTSMWCLELCLSSIDLGSILLSIRATIFKNVIC